MTTINWLNEQAVSQLKFMVNVFGRPTFVDLKEGGRAYWDQSTLQNTKLFGQANCLFSYEIRDEKISHKVPVDHYDNQYGTIMVDIDPKALPFVNAISGALSYDPLAGRLTARCDSLGPVLSLLYLALRVNDNPRRLKGMKEQNIYARLVRGGYTSDGKMNVPQVEKVYRKLCELLNELDPPKLNSWGNADRSYSVQTLLNANQEYVAEAQAKAAERRADHARRRGANANVQSKLNADARVAKQELDDYRRPIQVDGIRVDGREDPDSGTPLMVDPTGMLHKLSKKESDSADISLGLEEQYERVTDIPVEIRSVEPFRSGSSNINLSLESQYEAAYGRSVTINSVEPFRARSDIDLDLERQYEAAYGRRVTIDSVEPFRARSDIDLDLERQYEAAYGRSVTIDSVEPFTSRKSSKDLERLHSTAGWAERLADEYAEDNSKQKNGYNRNNAREYFCGRRQYNPDIPPCGVDHVKTQSCSACTDRIHTYDTGSLPARITDPPCFYGRRHDPYIDAAAYMRHFEDNAHDPRYYRNFY